MARTMEKAEHAEHTEHTTTLRFTDRRAAMAAYTRLWKAGVVVGRAKWGPGHQWLEIRVTEIPAGFNLEGPADDRDEALRAARFATVSALMDAQGDENKLSAMEHIIAQQWGLAEGRIRKALREEAITRKPNKPLNDRVRNRLYRLGILQFGTDNHDGHIGAHKYAQKRAVRLPDPHFIVVARHKVRQDHWVLFDQWPDPLKMDAQAVYRQDKVACQGWRVEWLETPSYISHWAVDVRCPVTGDVRTITVRARSGAVAEKMVQDRTANWTILGSEEVSAGWADAIPLEDWMASAVEGELAQE